MQKIHKVLKDLKDCLKIFARNRNLELILPFK